jgi:AraC-like DNA-binding protein
VRSRELIPAEPLRPYVRLIWLLELDDPAEFGPPERIGPDGLLELVFHYRTPLACRYDGEAFERQPRSVAVSQTRRFVEIRPEGPSGLIAVRFHPWGAYHFFHPPVSELADRQAPTEALWGREALELEERLAEASGDRARVALVEQFLLAQLRRHGKPDVEPLVRAVWRHRGRVAVSRLCRDLGIGERRLQRTLSTALGTTPKGLARLARFLHACSLLRHGRGRGLADVGLACGYYDQSHFIAEFKAFSGLTPRQFVETANVSFLELD